MYQPLGHRVPYLQRRELEVKSTGGIKENIGSSEDQSLPGNSRDVGVGKFEIIIPFHLGG